MTIITAAFATTSSTSQIRAGPASSPTTPRTAAVFAAAVSASAACKSRSWEQDTKLDEYFNVRVCFQ
ncbi:unnamed protein product [Sphagnum troendelagicum]